MEKVHFPLIARLHPVLVLCRSVFATSLSQGKSIETILCRPSQPTRLFLMRSENIEVPGGYFGSEFNDYFSAYIRSGAGELASESNSINGLGLGAFDGSGSTTWREVELPASMEGEIIQVNVVVANVGDDLMDKIEENKLAITALQLFVLGSLLFIAFLLP